MKNLFLILLLVSILKWEYTSGFIRSQSPRVGFINELNPQLLSSSKGPIIEEERESTEEKHEIICEYCGSPFKSRNALFRHLRSELTCYQKMVDAATSSGTTSKLKMMSNVKLAKHKVAISFGYQINKSSGKNDGENFLNNRYLPNQIVAKVIKESFFDSFDKLYPQIPMSSPDESGLTQATDVKLRHPVLKQDEFCSAYADCIGINFRASFPSSGGKEIFTTTDNSGIVDKIKLLEAMQQYINESITVSDENNIHLQRIQIHDIQMLPVKTRFHAESSCTQRTYQYLLPLDWLKDGDDIHAWWMEQSKLEENEHNKEGNFNRGHKKRARDVPPILQKLKQALKSAESSHVMENEDSKISSPGRFGSLALKERRCWHNFSSQKLGAGLAHMSVWRSVDRARSPDFFFHCDDDDGQNSKPLYIVLEISGDSFVLEQVRRIVATAVAITNGWLPESFFETATRFDVCGLETPKAPISLQYFFNGRFHFIELITNQKRLFQRPKYKNSNESNEEKALRLELHDRKMNWLSDLRSSLIQQNNLSGASSDWLHELENVVCPRINQQLEKISNDDRIRKENINAANQEHLSYNGLSSIVDEEADTVVPSIYRKTLNLLRPIYQEGKWPVTSAARSRVIRDPSSLSASELSPPQTDSKTITSVFPGKVVQSGSFTVVNPKLVDPDTRLPLGNELFQDLVSAVFQLEEDIAKADSESIDSDDENNDNIIQIADNQHKTKRNQPIRPRPPSTHCAINRNAEFTPHVDSGVGHGQSTSLIVGLGNIKSGGRLLVEGKPYDIKYKPLSFDGWNQRHWTETFTGERFSLVWFSPATTNKKEDGLVSEEEDNQQDTSTRSEDVVADTLVELHSEKLPNFPKLQYRTESTDSIVIKEILDDSTRGCAYESDDFSIKGHKMILDVGAHIGCFSRYALSLGDCKHIICYEPEPSNLELLRKNLCTDDNEIKIEIFGAAVTHIDEEDSNDESSRKKTLIRARNENSGIQNTWRHCLIEYSQYVDRDTPLPSESQENILSRSQVDVVPFFGQALRPGITLVKIDCEGPEIDILLSDEAAKSESWEDVTHLVFEWSATKERRISTFHHALRNLRSAGFNKITYEGCGSWWDKEGVSWPYHSDLLVYAERKVTL